MKRKAKQLMIKIITWALRQVLSGVLKDKDNSRLLWETKGDMMPILKVLEEADLVEKEYGRAW